MIVCPVVLGGGKRFFPAGVRLDLTAWSSSVGSAMALVVPTVRERTSEPSRDSYNPLRVRFQKHRRAGEPNPLLDCYQASGATLLADCVRPLATQSRAARLPPIAGTAMVWAITDIPWALAREETMYGLIGKMTAAPGKRDALIAILLEGTAAMPGCLSYIIAKDGSPPMRTQRGSTEVWDTKESNTMRRSRFHPSRTRITRGRPLIAPVSANALSQRRWGGTGCQRTANIQRDESCWGSASCRSTRSACLSPRRTATFGASACLAIERAAPYSGEFQNS